MTAPAQPSLYSRVERHLSKQRLAPFLAAAASNHQAAVALYLWNLNISGATYESLHVFEVAVRNAMDAELRKWNATQKLPSGASRSDDWLVEPAPLLTRLVGQVDIDTAYSRANKARRARGLGKPGHDDVLAQLSLSTWRFLLPDHDPGRQLLWSDALNNAFPHWTGTPEELTDTVIGVLDIRNRVAHLEPLLNMKNVRAQFVGMRGVLKAIDPSIEQWMVSNQRITSVLKMRPQVSA